MKKIILLICLVVFFGLNAQEMRLFDKAQDFYNYGDYLKAENQLLIVSNDVNTKPEYHKLLAQVYIAQQKFDLALKEYVLYNSSNFGRDSREVNKIIKILDDAVNKDEQSASVLMELAKLTGDINSSNSDFAPAINQDKKGMYYTSSKPSQFAKENIWFAEFDNGSWVNSSIVQNLSANGNESIGSLSSDGKTAYLFGNFGSAEQGDIFYSSYDNNAWSKPLALVAVNSEFTEMQPCITDNNILFFASNRPEGEGGFDIYVSEYKRGWTTPVNLGTVINTRFNEETPFLDWDGKTLYFASNGHAGLGELDIFKSTKIGESWQEWSEPENMGVIINSVRNDRGFTHAKNDNNWYLSSDRIGGNGYEDIYRVNITQIIPEVKPVTEVSGVVTDKETAEPIPELVIKIENKDTGNNITVNTDLEGKYTAVFESNHTYIFFLDKEGYNSLTEYIFVSGEEKIEKNFSLVPIIIDKPVEIDDIFFDFDSATLRDESFNALDILVRTLQANSKRKAEISAHTCNLGTEEYNLKLSKKRAASVVNYLIEHGIDKERLTSKGYGESMPKYSNETEEGRQHNRRVEMVVE